MRAGGGGGGGKPVETSHLTTPGTQQRALLLLLETKRRDKGSKGKIWIIDGLIELIAHFFPHLEYSFLFYTS